MIENQNLLFRPWKSTAMEIDPANCAFTPDMQNLKCEFTSLYVSNCRQTNRPQIQRSLNLSANKKLTDAERLKQSLLNEKSRESNKADKKSSIKKEIDTPRSNDAASNQFKSNSKTNSPASSSAETRLINSKISALSSAAHLLNLDSYGRLAPPISDNQLAAVMAASNAASAIPLPLNFLLPNGNLPPPVAPNHSLPLPNLPNNLPVANGLPSTLASNNLPADKRILPEINPNPVLPVHNQPSIANSLPSANNLPNIALPPPNQPAIPLPPAMISGAAMPISTALPPTPSAGAPFDSKQWSEMVASASMHLHNNGNLLPPSQCLPPSIPPGLLESGQFASLANDLSTDILMANIKKSHSIQQFKKNRPKKFVCTVGQCDSSFANNGQLKNHIRSHTGERPFACDHPNCNKRFTRNEELTRHKKIHSGEKPYPCQICKKKFGRKDHLKKHVKTHERAATQQQFAIPYPFHPYLYFKV